MKCRLHPMLRHGGAAAATLTILTVGSVAPQRTLAAAASNGDAPTACNKAALQAAAPADTTIVSAVRLKTPEPDPNWVRGAQKVPAPLSHCRVDGYVTTTNPGPNQVNFRLQLPDRELWNGRYYFIGLGGSAGYVPTDSQSQRGNPMYAGFAVAGTDTGRQGSGQDFSFMTDPVKALDHTHRGAHVAAVATQQMTKAYYGVDKMYRYHTGCSGGGRMGGEAYSRYDDYDGVLIGNGNGPVPKQPMGGVRGDGNGFVQMVRESNREPGSWLSPSKLQFVEQKVTAACDMTDGAKDDMIWDRKLCKFDFNTLKCNAGDKPDCLTQPEITSIVNLLNDPRRPISNMSGWTQYLGTVPPPWSPEQTPENLRKTSSAFITQTSWARTYLNQPDRDIVKNPLTEAEMSQIADAQQKTGYGKLPDPALFNAEKAGRKTIMYHGVSDPVISSYLVEARYQELASARNGDMARVQKFAKLYLVPGMVHCGGGTGPVDVPDVLLQALMDWVEKGKDPGATVAHRGDDRARRMFATNVTGPGPSPGTPPNATGAPTATSLPSRDFVLCPYPQVSVFDKSKANIPGAVYEASNWSCTASRD